MRNRVREQRTQREMSQAELAAALGVSRQTVHTWLRRYEEAGLEGLADRSHRPVRCPRQMTAPQDRD